METQKDKNLVGSLLSMAIEYVINNLSLYETPSLTLLPYIVKNRLLKKFTTTSYFSRNVIFMNFFKAFVNKATTQINLTSVLVTDETLRILCTCQNLQRLYLTREGSNCKVTSEGIVNLLQHTPKLQNLVIMRSDAVNDKVIETLTVSCPGLLGLDIGGCVNVTDKGLGFLGKMQIKWLRISWTQITDKGITKLVEGSCGQALAELVLDNCFNVTHIGLNKITECCPNLTVLNFLNCNTDIFTTEVLISKLPLKQLFWQIPL